MQSNVSIQSWEDYQRVYDYSLKNNSEFWSEVASRLKWRKTWSKVSDCDYKTGRVRWYLGAELNVAENCLDRHLVEGRGEKKALIWVGNQPSEQKSYTFKELHQEVCRMSNVLENLGVQKGDRVVIYLPSVPELAISTLACARIGAIHSIIFGGFSAASIQNRVMDCGAKLIITANGTYRGSKWIALKDQVDEALAKGCPSVEKVIVLNRDSAQPCQMGKIDLAWEKLMNSSVSTEHVAPSHSAEDPLFILYTSGSTGKPKGVLHKTGGYLAYISYTYEIVFQPKKDDIYWCTADLGWITGHSYLLYGPLANGVTTLMYEGVPTYPDASRFWQIVDQHHVSIFYTSPTALRILASAGDDFVKKCQRKSLRTLGTVGEPISPETWKWYSHVVGEDRSPIVDTWWQTETGGILISPLAGITETRPGSATFPLPGIEPMLLDEKGKILQGEQSGALVLARSWPGQMTEVYGDSERFFKTYFTQYSGYYFSGDQSYRDAEGYYWIRGRMDDVIKVSGHRLGTAEIEAACLTHSSVVESAAVGIPDEKTGEALVCFVVIDQQPSPALEKELVQVIRKEVGPLATPHKIYWAPGLPKTRSGKIMRRILRKIATGHTSHKDELGDISTLIDPTVVDQLVAAVEKQNQAR